MGKHITKRLLKIKKNTYLYKDESSLIEDRENLGRRCSPFSDEAYAYKGRFPFDSTIIFFEIEKNNEVFEREERECHQTGHSDASILFKRWKGED